MVMSGDGWKKSSYSSDTANCVEVARSGVVLIRDSKDPAGPRLRFDHQSWRAFLTMVKSG